MLERERAAEYIECGHAATIDQTYEMYGSSIANENELELLVLQKMLEFHTMVIGFLYGQSMGGQGQEEMRAFSRKQILEHMQYVLSLQHY